MDLTMVTAAQGHGELVAHLAAERWTLRKAHMMGVRWSSSADQAGLLRNEADVVTVSDPPRLGEGKHTLVNIFGAALPPWPDEIASGNRLHALWLY
jgi:hypothetical protein